MRLVITTVLLSACMEPRINPNDPKWVYNEFKEKWKGDKGDKGDTGEQGIQGFAGINGIDGIDGAVGPQGPIGPVGPQGQQGIKGDTGERGPVGPIGPQGIQGVVGPVGPVGPQGIQGDKGDKGDRGEAGICTSNIIRTTATIPQSQPIADPCPNYGQQPTYARCPAQRIFIAIPELTADIIDNGYIIPFFRMANSRVWSQNTFTTDTIYSNSTVSWNTKCPYGGYYNLVSTSYWSYTPANTNENGRFGPNQFRVEIAEGGLFVSVNDTTNNNSPCIPQTPLEFKIVVIK